MLGMQQTLALKQHRTYVPSTSGLVVPFDRY